MQFVLPYKMPTLYLSFGFCIRYHAANVITGFRINHDCLKEIEAFYSQKKRAKRTHVKGMDEFLNIELPELGKKQQSEKERSMSKRRSGCR